MERAGAGCWVAACWAETKAKRTSEAKEIRVRQQTLACWAAHEAGPEKKKGGEGKKERFNYFLKRHQTNEFKLKLEFKQAKAMHQHECNNKLL
jgi:hypothetical protein